VDCSVRYFVNRLAVSVSVLVMATPVWAADSITFPGKVSEIKSPDGLFVISSADKHFKSGWGDIHELYIRKSTPCDATRLRAYSRTADVVWCPDSSAFVINDWAGSNIAFAYLYRVGDLSHPVAVGKKLFHCVTDKTDKRTLTKSEHLYIIANKWIGPDSLEVKATGHNDETGKAFTYLYKWDLKDSFEKTSRTDQETPTRIEQSAN